MAHGQTNASQEVPQTSFQPVRCQTSSYSIHSPADTTYTIHCLDELLKVCQIFENHPSKFCSVVLPQKESKSIGWYIVLHKTERSLSQWHHKTGCQVEKNAILLVYKAVAIKLGLQLFFFDMVILYLLPLHGVCIARNHHYIQVSMKKV